MTGQLFYIDHSEVSFGIAAVVRLFRFYRNI